MIFSIDQESHASTLEDENNNVNNIETHPRRNGTWLRRKKLLKKQARKRQQKKLLARKSKFSSEK